MTQPTPYNRDNLNGETYFTDWTTSHPTTPQQGNKMDQEYNAIALTLGEVLTNLALIQRDDGGLANASVGTDQLKSDISAGVNPPAAWVTATVYAKNDTVINGTGWYRCIVAHTSGTFATDLAAGDWTLLFNMTALVTAGTMAGVLTAGTNIAIGLSAGGTQLSIGNTYVAPANDEGYSVMLGEYFA
jgi:hypothetical protein